MRAWRELQDGFFNFGATNEKWIAPKHRVRRARTAPSNAPSQAPAAKGSDNTQATTLVRAASTLLGMGCLWY